MLPTGPAPLLVFSSHKEIRSISIHTQRMQVLVSGLKSAIGMDFNWREQRLYWSDVSQDRIERIFLNGTGREVVISKGMNSPEGNNSVLLSSMVIIEDSPAHSK